MLVTSAPHLELFALPGLPIARPGDDVALLLADSLEHSGIGLCNRDVLVVTSKLLSRAENRFVDVHSVSASPRAQALAVQTGMDARLVELILGESVAVSRAVPGALIVRHRLGFISANAGIDASNAMPPDAAPGSGPWVLLIPHDPDAGAEAIRAALGRRFAVDIGVVISDSFGRPFRQGTVGAAIGVAGLPALNDLRGELDLGARPLAHTITGVADQVAAAADMVAGQAGEGRAAVLVRGLDFEPGEPGRYSASELCRPADKDLYA